MISGENEVLRCEWGSLKGRFDKISKIMDGKELRVIKVSGRRKNGRG